MEWILSYTTAMHHSIVVIHACACVQVCGFVDLQHFATVGHTEMLSLYTNIRKMVPLTIPVSCRISFPSLLLPSLMKIYQPFAIMSTCQLFNIPVTSYY
jgi:hypothetical protein